MADHQIFTSRLRGRPLLDSEDVIIGRIRDVVDPVRRRKRSAARARAWWSPCSAAASSSTSAGSRNLIDGARLRGGTVDLRHFTRPGRVSSWRPSCTAGVSSDGTVCRHRLAPREQPRVGWEVVALAIAQGRACSPRPDDRGLGQAPGALPDRSGRPTAGRLRELQPADLADPSRPATEPAGQIAGHPRDEQLADLLEEMPEEEQIRPAGRPGAGAQCRRGGGDAARRRRRPARRHARGPPDRLLAEIESVEAAALRRLLGYEPPRRAA